MRTLFLSLTVIFLCVVANVRAQSWVGKVNFDDSWRFYKGAALGAEQNRFDDSKWQTVDLPHDWSIEDKPGTRSPFNTDAISQVDGGFTTGGTGWYRKSFTVPASEKGRRIKIIFDGVYMNADVWINGRHLGNHPYGYTGFQFDVTDQIIYGGSNIIAVEVKNEGQNSRWYSGSGIYRHVWIKYVPTVYIDPLGVQISTPLVSIEKANVSIKTAVSNASEKETSVTLVSKVLGPDGAEVATATGEMSLIPRSTKSIQSALIIKNPVLWSTSSPALYKTILQLYQDKQLIGTEEFFTGIRKIEIDAVNGFRLNGIPLKLKGACFHHDNGPLGARAYDRAEERKVQLLKASGFNAIRCSHNPPSPAFLAACDREGILVIDEAFDMWQEPKNPFDYHLYFDKWWQRDVDAMVLRDRNHPSVVMWSIGNEIPEAGTASGAKTAQMLADYIRVLDSTRAITSAVNDVRPGKDPYFKTLDVAGYNYAYGNYQPDHDRLPERVMVCTESFPLQAFEYWTGVLDHPWVIGDFVWTGFDYMGEASIGWLGHPHTKDFYPWNLAYCGDIDICGWKRPQSYYRDVLWGADQLSVFVTPPKPSFPLNPNRPDWSKWYWYDTADDWNWKGYENKPLNVVVYSSCALAELFLNGKSLGKKVTGRASKYLAEWAVPYAAGSLKAIGYDDNGKVVKQATLTTASGPAAISLKADTKTIKADNQDLCYVTVELKDKQGIRNPKAENLLNFTIEGPATIAGVGNANPTSTESNQLPRRKAWRGRCLVIIKSTKKGGKIVLKVNSTGIPAASVAISSI